GAGRALRRSAVRPPFRRLAARPADLRRHPAAARRGRALRERAAGLARLARRPDGGAARRVSLAGAAARLAGALLLAGALAAGAPALAQDALAGLPELQSGAVRVYLIRHGQALSNLDPAPRVSAAELDHLTPLGTKQSEAAGRTLAGRNVAAVFSSPASRARGVAAPTVETRLRPLELGRAPDRRALAWKDRAVDWQAGRDPVPAEG